MASTSFKIETYSVYMNRDGTIGGSEFDSAIALRGGGHFVYVHFMNDDNITLDNVWNPSLKFGRLYLRKNLLPTVIDILRNENPVYCIMNDTIPSACQISTSNEPIGEGEN